MIRQLMQHYTDQYQIQQERAHPDAEAGSRQH